MDLPRSHEAAFERYGYRPGTMRDLAVLLRRTLQRIRTVTEEFHLVLHTSPNTLFQSESLDIGRRSTTTITGTSRFCRLSVDERSRIRLKRFIIRR